MELGLAPPGLCFRKSVGSNIHLEVRTDPTSAYSTLRVHVGGWTSESSEPTLAQRHSIPLNILVGAPESPWVPQDLIAVLFSGIHGSAVSPDCEPAEPSRCAHEFSVHQSPYVVLFTVSPSPTLMGTPHYIVSEVLASYRSTDPRNKASPRCSRVPKGRPNDEHGMPPLLVLILFLSSFLWCLSYACPPCAGASPFFSCW